MREWEEWGRGEEWVGGAQMGSVREKCRGGDCGVCMVAEEVCLWCRHTQHSIQGKRANGETAGTC